MQEGFPPGFLSPYAKKEMGLGEEDEYHESSTSGYGQGSWDPEYIPDENSEWYEEDYEIEYQLLENLVNDHTAAREYIEERIREAMEDARQQLMEERENIKAWEDEYKKFLTGTAQERGYARIRVGYYRKKRQEGLPSTPPPAKKEKKKAVPKVAAPEPEKPTKTKPKKEMPKFSKPEKKTSEVEQEASKNSLKKLIGNAEAELKKITELQKSLKPEEIVVISGDALSKPNSIGLIPERIKDLKKDDRVSWKKGGATNYGTFVEFQKFTHGPKIGCIVLWKGKRLFVPTVMKDVGPETRTTSVKKPEGCPDGDHLPDGYKKKLYMLWGTDRDRPSGACFFSRMMLHTCTHIMDFALGKGAPKHHGRLYVPGDKIYFKTTAWGDKNPANAVLRCGIVVHANPDQERDNLILECVNDKVSGAVQLNGPNVNFANYDGRRFYGGIFTYNGKDLDMGSPVGWVEGVTHHIPTYPGTSASLVWDTKTKQPVGFHQYWDLHNNVNHWIPYSQVKDEIDKAIDVHNSKNVTSPTQH